MIVSASRRTDIPAFYGRWFMNRLRAGCCKTRNPFTREVFTVSLRPEDVDGFFFWTKNVGPFMDNLAAIHAQGRRFVVLYTINGYPRELEPGVPPPERSTEHLKALARLYGSRVAVWRYDTIVCTSLTDYAFHIRNFERLARALAGATDEAIISFPEFYRKTLKNLNKTAQRLGFTWSDPPDDEKRALVSELTAIARGFGMKLSVCCQPQYVVEGAQRARCVDANRLMDVSGRQFHAALKGTRKECGCFESRDIGDYDTCPHGCVYCYAVSNPELARRRYGEHREDGEFLWG